MQFLWRFIDDLVGKGLTFGVISELFFYAALTMVPLALPLAILLASLMTFGNLGEHFELTAMKASGISLIRTMRPLIIIIIFIAIGAFFFQNNLLPVAQTKMWTLLYSMRQKSPELDIPEGAFYDQIPNYNLYVQNKDPETGMLYSVMIYDISKGFENARIILADSGKMSMTDDKSHLFLRLWNGEQFENLREQSAGGRSRNVPYRKESFDIKEILVQFDANFNRMDESGMRSQYVGKNINELQSTIDSVQLRVDSIGNTYASSLKSHLWLNFKDNSTHLPNKSIATNRSTPSNETVKDSYNIILDSLFAGTSPSNAKTIVSQALAKAKRQQQDYEFKSYAMYDDMKTIRMHKIELMKKFTLSFACIIFFFIGAPLGAIIKRGGLGAPLVISVILFIVYYIFDNSGYKLARDGRWEVWAGMLLSSVVLLPLGIFFTYKAVNDSAVFNNDAYKQFFKRLSGRQKRGLQVKEFTLNEVDITYALTLVIDFNKECKKFLSLYCQSGFLKKMWLIIINIGGIKTLESAMNEVISYLSDYKNPNIIYYLNNYPYLIRFGKNDIKKIIENNETIINLLETQSNNL